MIFVHQFDFFVEFVNLFIFGLNNFLQSLFFLLRWNCIFFFFFWWFQKRNWCDVHLGSNIGEFFLFFSDYNGDSVLEVPNLYHEFVDLYLKLFAHLRFFLNFQMKFVSVLLNYVLFPLQILSHCRQFILVVLLQCMNVRVSELCQFDFHGLVLLIVRLLFCEKQCFKVFNL